MDRRFLIIIAALFLGFVGVFYITQHKSTPASTAAHSNHTSGTGSLGVELVEYGDFQCSACGHFYPTIEDVRAQYGDTLKFTFRNFPLDTVHRNARAAHRAAEAASIQGKFFEMYKQLYANQQDWSELSDPVPVFNKYAGDLGLDVNKFKTDFASSTVNDVINADQQEGQKLGVDSTPSFFINGQKVDNNTIGGPEDFIRLIDDAAAKAKASATATSTPAATASPVQ